MFFKIWNLRTRKRQNLLTALRSLDAFMAFWVLTVVLSGQSFISPSKAGHLFIGSLMLLIIKLYFEKKTNYTSVYLAFTMQFVTHLFLYERPKILVCLDWIISSLMANDVNWLMKILIMYLVIYLISLLLFTLIHFYCYFEEQFTLLKTSMELTRLVKNYPYQSVEEIKSELYKQHDLNDILIMPFVFLIPAANKGLINSDIQVISDLTLIAKKLAIYATPDSLSKVNVHTLLDLINYFWLDKKKK